MPKRRAIRRECHIVPGERPAIAWDRLVEETTSTAFFIRPGNKLAICGPVRRSGCPHGLRLGPNETIWAIALKLSAAPAIQKAIIGPGLRNHLMELHLPAPPVTPWASPFRRYTRSRRHMWRRSEEHKFELQSL